MENQPRCRWYPTVSHCVASLYHLSVGLSAKFIDVVGPLSFRAHIEFTDFALIINKWAAGPKTLLRRECGEHRLRGRVEMVMAVGQIGGPTVFANECCL